MAGLVPAIHAGTCIGWFESMAPSGAEKTRWRSESAVSRHDVDTRHKAGHDADGDGQAPYLSADALSRG